jgi:hypothetical protein
MLHFFQYSTKYFGHYMKRDFRLSPLRSLVGSHTGITDSKKIKEYKGESTFSGILFVPNLFVSY